MAQINLTALICVMMICNDVEGNVYVFQPVYVLFYQLSYLKTRGGVIISSQLVNKMSYLRESGNQCDCKIFWLLQQQQQQQQQQQPTL